MTFRFVEKGEAWEHTLAEVDQEGMTSEQWLLTFVDTTKGLMGLPLDPWIDRSSVDPPPTM